jgi:hypothetical protein
MKSRVQSVSCNCRLLRRLAMARANCKAEATKIGATGRLRLRAILCGEGWTARRTPADVQNAPGMRLAFAVIAHVHANILIIDEALAVGDAFFVQKCMRFLRRFMETL